MQKWGETEADNALTKCRGWQGLSSCVNPSHIQEQFGGTAYTQRLYLFPNLLRTFVQ